MGIEIPNSEWHLVEDGWKRNQDKSGGWTYKQEPFKIGAPFTFETADYIVQGEVANITWPVAGSVSSVTGTGGTSR